MAPEKETAAPESQKGGAPDKAQLQKSVTVAKRVVELQKTAEGLKQRATSAVNPKERVRLLQEAYEKEVEAHGQSNYAKRLQSGAWQGVTAGGGIGGGVALGTGAAVGTLVTGLVSVPTVLLGGLIGAGVGSIHGPFIKFGGGEGKNKMTQEEVHAQAVREAEKLDAAVENSASRPPQPPKLEQEDSTEVQKGGERTPSNQTTPTPQKKKPRKLEIRSGNKKGQNS